MTSREKAKNYLTVDRIAEYRLSDIDSLTFLLDKHGGEMKLDQRSSCTAAVDMAFHHARSHGYTKEETESHVMMACLHAGCG